MIDNYILGSGFLCTIMGMLIGSYTNHYFIALPYKKIAQMEKFHREENSPKVEAIIRMNEGLCFDIRNQVPKIMEEHISKKEKTQKIISIVWNREKDFNKDIGGEW